MISKNEIKVFILIMIKNLLIVYVVFVNFFFMKFKFF